MAYVHSDAGLLFEPCPGTVDCFERRQCEPGMVIPSNAMFPHCIEIVSCDDDPDNCWRRPACANSTPAPTEPTPAPTEPTPAPTEPTPAPTVCEGSKFQECDLTTSTADECKRYVENPEGVWFEPCTAAADCFERRQCEPGTVIPSNAMFPHCVVIKECDVDAEAYQPKAAYQPKVPYQPKAAYQPKAQYHPALGMFVDAATSATCWRRPACNSEPTAAPTEPTAAPTAPTAAPTEPTHCTNCANYCTN